MPCSKIGKETLEKSNIAGWKMIRFWTVGIGISRVVFRVSQLHDFAKFMHSLLLVMGECWFVYNGCCFQEFGSRRNPESD